MTTETILSELAAAVDGTITEVGQLPDGSGFALMSMPLPTNHWSVIDPDGFNVPPMGLRVGCDHPHREALATKIREAGRYAYRCATMNGKDCDMDPDALIQNLVVGLLGYWTPNALSADEWANPANVPSEIGDLTYVL